MNTYVFLFELQQLNKEVKEENASNKEYPKKKGVPVKRGTS